LTVSRPKEGNGGRQRWQIGERKKIAATDKARRTASGSKEGGRKVGGGASGKVGWEEMD